MRHTLAPATLLYGRLKGAPEWQEQILCSLPEHFERAKELATADGFAHFRVAHFDDSPPDFAGTVRKVVRK